MSNCRICPRNCNVDRKFRFGYCKSSDKIHVVRAKPHFFEEPCISGKNGSGTVFFSGCSLGCVFCQNYEISGNGNGKEFSKEEFADFLLRYSESGVENINLVTPTHFSEQICEALKLVKDKIKIPIVWNSSGYEKAETIKKLSGLVDIYLVDSKFYSSEVSKKYSNAENYFKVNIEALKEMFLQKPENVFDENGMLKSGVIVRHLVLPSHTHDSKKILFALKENFSNKIFISLMCQYIPSGRASDFEEINRRLKRKEYAYVISYMEELGFENGYIQEFSSAGKEFVPDFDVVDIY